MKKRIKILFLIVLFLMLTPCIASAAPTKQSSNTTCSEVNATVTEYQTIQSELESLNCEETSDVEDMAVCNNNINRRAYVLSKLFKMNDDKPECKSAALTDIINKNKDECHSVLNSSIKDISNNILTIFYIVAPFLLIIFGSIDLTKLMAASSPKMILKIKKDFFRRILAMIGVYLIPIFINFIIGLNISGASLDGNVYACNKNLNYSVDHWDTVYIPRTTGATANGINTYSGNITVNSQGTAAMLEAASKLNAKFVSEKWTYGGCYSSNIEASINCSSKQLVCADLIAQVLYLGNVFTAEEINSTKYNGCCGLYHFLLEQGWQRIERYEDLQPGDVCFFREDTETYHESKATQWFMKHTIGPNGLHVEYGHTALYAGDDTWYDTGSTESIQRKSPYKDSSYHKSTFAVALRMP